MYGMTLSILKIQNYQLWFTVSLRLGRIYLEQSKNARLEELVKSLKESCKKQQDQREIAESSNLLVNQYDLSKINLLLETFALEIQLCDQTKDSQRLKILYP
jgi:COP9 signalosome complex subunit 2